MKTESACSWLHQALSQLPFFKFPFEIRALPDNGIYFFYEQGEIVRHADRSERRVVRVGTHKDGNFQSRLNQHYLATGETRSMSFGPSDAAPKDHSIFRKHLGRCLLSTADPSYLTMWNIDFKKKRNRLNANLIRKRDIVLERTIERKVTSQLRSNFSFRFIAIDDQTQRMGDTGFERRLVGTLSQCDCCQPTKHWLGRKHPLKKVQDSGLWQVHYLGAEGLDTKEQKLLERLIGETVKII